MQGTGVSIQYCFDKDKIFLPQTAVFFIPPETPDKRSRFVDIANRQTLYSAAFV
jgi:hypothetical protein